MAPDEDAVMPDVEEIGDAGQEGGASASNDSTAADSGQVPDAGPAQGARPVVPGPLRPSPRPDYRARSGGFVDRRSFAPGGASAPWSRPPVGPPAADLLGEDEEVVAGRHPVEEAFIAHRKAIRLLVVPQRRLALEKLVLHATNLRIPIVEVEGGTLTALAGFDGHQGIALVTDRRQFAGLDDILARAIERKEAPFVLVLDSLEDPQNFGSLLRTAEASGVHGVVYPVRRQAPLSAAAVKASAGAVEHLLLVPVEDLAEALTELHVRGLRVIGSDADASLTARQADLRGPVVVVVGSEGQGLGPAVRRRCDTVVRIPMRGRITSLNAAVAGSILLYEASSQRSGDRPVIGPEPGRGEEIAAILGIDADDESGMGDQPTTSVDRSDTSVPSGDLAAAQAAIAPEAALGPAAKPRARSRKVVQPGPIEAIGSVDATAAPDEDALLPGSAALGSGDASGAE
jgi:23S rRNA (guanosine2251-2'-O)-methyltransferase